MWVGVGWGGVGGHVNVPCTSYMIYCHAAKISGIVCDVTCCYAAKISGIADYVTCCYACVAAMTLKSQKTRPKFFQDFQSSNQHGTVVKSHLKKKKKHAFYGNGFRSGGLFLILYPGLLLLLPLLPPPYTITSHTNLTYNNFTYTNLTYNNFTHTHLTHTQT